MERTPIFQAAVQSAKTMFEQLPSPADRAISMDASLGTIAVIALVAVGLDVAGLETASVLAMAVGAVACAGLTVWHIAHYRARGGQLA